MIDQTDDLQKARSFVARRRIGRRPDGRLTPARHDRRRLLLAGGGLLLAIAILVAALTLVEAGGMRGDLERGRDALARADSLLRSNRVAAAERAFLDARASFRRAEADVRGPLIRVYARLPIVGRTTRATEVLASVGEEVSSAGVELVRSVAALPAGLSSLLPRDGRLPVRSYLSLAPVLSRTTALLERAEQTASRISTLSLVVPEVAGAVRSLQARLARGLALLRPIDAMAGALPRFAGTASPRRYLVAFQNPGELRGTGGFIGLYGVLTIRDGEFSLGSFPSTPLTVAAPGEEWGRIGSDPDVPTVGALLQRVWNRARRPAVDGVILVDPQLFEPMLQSTGNIEAPGLDYVLTPRNVVAFTMNGAYFLYPDRPARMGGLASIARTALERFLRSSPSLSGLDGFLSSARAGYVAAYSDDPTVEAAFRAMGIAGSYGPDRPGQAFLGLVEVNRAGNKVDYYVRRSIRYAVSLMPGGTASQRVTVSFWNGASPARREGNEVFNVGPWGLPTPPPLSPGEDYGTLHLYCGAGCRMASASLVAPPPGLPVGSGSPWGLRDYQAILRVPPQGTQRFDWRGTTSRAWTSTGRGGVFRLRLQDQPVIQPTEVTVTIRVPAGMRIVSTAPSMRIAGSEAVWHGVLRTARDLEVVFVAG